MLLTSLTLVGLSVNCSYGVLVLVVLVGTIEALTMSFCGDDVSESWCQ